MPFRRRRYDEGVVGWVATHRRPLDVPDVFADPRVSAPAFCRRHGLTSFYGLPIVLDIFPLHKYTRYWGDMTRTVAV